MGMRAWWRSFVQARARRTYVAEWLRRMERGRAEMGMPPLTREQRQAVVIDLTRLAVPRMKDGRSVWK